MAGLKVVMLCMARARDKADTPYDSMHAYLAGVRTVTNVLTVHPAVNSPQDLLACVEALCVCAPRARLVHPLPIHALRVCMDRFYDGMADVANVHHVVDIVRRVDVMAASNMSCLLALVMCGAVPWITTMERGFHDLAAKRATSDMQQLQRLGHLFTREAFRPRTSPDEYLVNLGCYSFWNTTKPPLAVNLAHVLHLQEAKAFEAASERCCSKPDASTARYHAFQLPCGHTMHTECLMARARKAQPKCSICRVSLLLPKSEFPLLP